LAARLAQFCLDHDGFEDVRQLCVPLLTNVEPRSDSPKSEEVFGYVYLLKSGRHYKIGRSNAAGRRERELAIQLPDRAAIVHKIKTDDPVGVESYWHRRFNEYRKNGEWFELSAEHVTAFKRRKFM
jgi:hypothetical protein